MVRRWWHKLFSQGRSRVRRGDRWARVRQRRRQKPLLESLEERCLLSYQITNLGALASQDDSFASGINDSDPNKLRFLAGRNDGVIVDPDF